MLPETALAESMRQLLHYMGIFLAAPNPTISARDTSLAPSIMRQHITVIEQEAARAQVYIDAVGVGANPRAIALAAQRAEALALAAQAEALV